MCEKTPHKVNDSTIQVDGKSGKGGKGEEGVADKLYTGESKTTATVTPYLLDPPPLKPILAQVLVRKKSHLVKSRPLNCRSGPHRVVALKVAP